MERPAPAAAMNARLFLLLYGALFLVSAVAGIVFLRVAPEAASIGSLVMALALGVGFVALAWRQPSPQRACPRCARELDGSLGFCARCGEAPRGLS